GANYILRVAGHPGSVEGFLTVGANRTNNGTIKLGATDQTRGTINVTGGTFLNASGGTVESADTNVHSPNFIQGNFTNQGTLTLTDSLSSTALGTWSNSGSITIPANKSLTLPWNASSSFTQTGGSIANSGSFVQTNGSFTASGGTATGTPLEFDHVTISPSGTGSGTFEMRGGDDVQGSNAGETYAVRGAGHPGTV